MSAEVVALEADAMIAEGRKLAEIAPNITVKLPLTWDGLKACKVLSGEGKMVNVTLCFSANQALLAAKAGATFISPFIGRLDDMALDGCELIEDIRTIYDNYGFETQILAASIRSVNHVLDVARIGADVMTAPPEVIRKLANHPLTDAGLAQFMKDWEKTGQKNPVSFAIVRQRTRKTAVNGQAHHVISGPWRRAGTASRANPVGPGPYSG